MVGESGSSEDQVKGKMNIWSFRERRLAKAIMHFPDLIKKVLGDPDSKDEKEQKENHKILSDVNGEFKDFLYEVAAYLNEFPGEPDKALHHVEVRRGSVLHSIFIDCIKEKATTKEEQMVLRFDCEQAVGDFEKRRA